MESRLVGAVPGSTWSKAMRSVLAWNGFNTEIGGVDNVNASRFLLGRRSAGLLRIPYVFAGSQCLQVVRVPPRARITPRQRGCCLNVWTLALVGSL